MTFMGANYIIGEFLSNILVAILMVMALNMSIFSGSGSADSEVDQTASEVPEYVSYIMLFVVSMSIPVVIVPALWAIAIIVKNKKLQTNNNIFLINLLLTDVGFAVMLWCTNGLLTVLYLLGVNVDVGCNLKLIPVMILMIANKLMFIPMCVDRFIHIAFPFSYKRIVTTKAVMNTIIILWMVAIVATTFVVINGEPFTYIPSLGSCKPSQISIQRMLVMLGCFFVPIVLIITTSIYLRYKIIKSNNFFHSVKRNAAQQRRSQKAGRLAEILQEQVKPTLAVFRVGGIDAALDILIALLTAVTNILSPSSATAFIVIQLMAIPIQYIQSANHSLIYNRDIREKMIGCIRMRKKHSKVVVLHRR